jgi:hypothetical protein
MTKATRAIFSQTNLAEYRLHVVLDYVRKYIDRRAFISKGGVIKYSIAVREARNKPVRFERRVLVPKNIHKIFYEVNNNH